MVLQLSRLLDQIDTKSYNKPLAIFKGATLGQHFRHILDFYSCLSAGFETGLIDYSNRERNAKVEQDKDFAKSRIEAVLEMVCGIEETTSIKVKADFSTSSEVSRPIVHSTVGREIVFAYDHALHHLAIIRMGIQTAFPHLEMAENLGVAPATVKYRAGGKATDH